MAPYYLLLTTYYLLLTTHYLLLRWRAELGMAPLEIRHSIGASPPPQLLRSLVVQMPAGVRAG